MAVKRDTDLTIRQGDTFVRELRWETTPFVWKPITAIGNVAPALITATGHGLTNGWRVAVIDAGGMVQINKTMPLRDSDLDACTVVDANTIALNDVSAVNYDTYTGGGYVVFYTPQDLTGYTARMKIKDRAGGNLIFSITTPAVSGTGFTIDNTAKTITLNISATDTAALSFTGRAVYDLEMVSPAGIVTAILAGDVALTLEVTT